MNALADFDTGHYLELIGIFLALELLCPHVSAAIDNRLATPIAVSPSMSSTLAFVPTWPQFMLRRLPLVNPSDCGYRDLAEAQPCYRQFACARRMDYNPPDKYIHFLDALGQLMAAAKIYSKGSAEGLAEAQRRIAEAKRTGAVELDIGGLGLEIKLITFA